MPDVVVDATLSAWLRAAGDRIARAEAERLAAFVLDRSWSDLWPVMDVVVEHGAFAALELALARREAGEPLAYILGSVVFFGHEIACGPGVLVPRPETEMLVDVALELIEGIDAPVVVDIGTGTGCIALAISRARPDADVSATDISQHALRWARRNTGDANVRLVHGDLFDGLDPSLRGCVDLVVSNPPYVSDVAFLPDDVCAEPTEALRAGPVGAEILLRVVHEADAWLRRDGAAIALEVGTREQAVSIERALQRFGRTGTRNDLTDRPRVVWGRR